MVDRIEFLFRTSLYALLAMSAVSIGLAEGNLFPHLLTLPLIALAYFYLDRNPILNINNLLTGVLGLVALGIAFLEFRQGRINVEMRIFAASHLLAYFAWIVLLVKKQNQQYWWILALSVLNMSISASLTNSSALGLAILCYLFLAIWTLTLFTTYRGTASLRYSSGQQSAKQEASSSSSAISKTASDISSPKNTLTGIASKVRGGFHVDPSETRIGLRLLSVVVFISVASMFVGMGLFLITPRVWIGHFQFPSSTSGQSSSLRFGNPVSGFTSEVKLGDIGKILQNSSPVLQVKMYDYQTGRVLSSEEVSNRLHHSGLKLRGTALSIYRRGSWTGTKDHQSNVIRPAREDYTHKAMRFSYELEPVGQSLLFAFFPINAGHLKNHNNSRRSNFDQNSITGELYIPPDFLSSFDTVKYNTVKYETVCEPAQQLDRSGFPVIVQKNVHVRIADAKSNQKNDPQGFQKVLDTISTSLEKEYQNEMKDSHTRRTDFSRFAYRNWHSSTRVKKQDGYLRSLLAVDRQQLARLIATSKELCKKEEAITPVERIQTLYNSLRNSSDFSYTLDLSITDPTIDPVEDFLFNRKSGHCEYFASALTLMLRGVGIPARLVTGFSEGRWDEKTERLLIEQRHAHAWVEAFVDGRWLVLDPTPASGSGDQIGLAASAFSWEAIQGSLSAFWKTYVLGVSLAKQNEDIYNPLNKKVTSTFFFMNEFIGLFLEDNSTGKTNDAGKTGFNSFVVILVVMISNFILLAYLFRSRFANLFHYLLPGRSSKRQQKVMLLFFRRFLDLAARNGLKKQPEQTAREFAHLFQKRFHQQLAAVSLNSLPDSLTNAYYQARFRGNELSKQEIQNWKLQIDQLAQAMKRQR